MRLLKLMLTASGKQGVPQGGVISPLLSNIYLTEVDRMLERAKETTRNGKYTYVEYARFADDLVVLIDAHPRNAWLLGAVNKRLREEFAKLQVEINEEKSRIADLDRAGKLRLPGVRFPTPAQFGKAGVASALYAEDEEAHGAIAQTQGRVPAIPVPPVDRVVQLINPVLRGWVGITSPSGIPASASPSYETG